VNLPFVFLLLLFGHVVGDFYLQTNRMAEKKNECWGWFVGHGAIYTMCMAIILFLGVAPEKNLLWMFLFVAGTHIAIDLVKRCLKSQKQMKQIMRRMMKRIFILDQLAHLLSLGIAWFVWGSNLLMSGWAMELSVFISRKHLVMLLGLLIVLRPIGLLIKYGDIWDLSKKGKTASKSQKGAGEMIGYLERIIIFFMLVYGQFAAISFVIAAKSVMRFPEISRQNKRKGALAEYYLIGTLLSVTSVFAVSLLLGLIGI